MAQREALWSSGALQSSALGRAQLSRSPDGTRGRAGAAHIKSLQQGGTAGGRGAPVCATQ